MSVGPERIVGVRPERAVVVQVHQASRHKVLVCLYLDLPGVEGDVVLMFGDELRLELSVLAGECSLTCGAGAADDYLPVLFLDAGTWTHDVDGNCKGPDARGRPSWRREQAGSAFELPSYLPEQGR